MGLLETALRQHRNFELRGFAALANSAHTGTPGFVASVHPVAKLVGSGCVPVVGLHASYKEDDASILARVTLVALPYARVNVVPAPLLVLFDASLNNKSHER